METAQSFTTLLPAIKKGVMAIAKTSNYLQDDSYSRFFSLSDDLCRKDTHSRVIYQQTAPMEEGITVLGFCLISILRDGVAELEAYAVNPSFPKQGYASMAVSACMKSLASAGIKIIEAKVHKLNVDGVIAVAQGNQQQGGRMAGAHG